MGFHEAAVKVPGVSAEALYGLCWPEDASPQQRVSLASLPSGEVRFEALEGASNSTARCLREIAATWPGKKAPGEVKLAPPARRPSGWVVLAYVQLLSTARFGPERGLLDPAPLVHGCLSQGDSPRDGLRFVVANDPELKVHLESAEGQALPPLTESERCIEAVLGATVWPNTRGFQLDFSPPDPAGVAAKGEVGHYFGPPGGTVQGLDPAVVKEVLVLSGPAVTACWEAALLRRAGLLGGRSVRLRVEGSGALSRVWVIGNVSVEPATAADYLLDRCLVAAAARARFPPSAPGDGVYSWVFAERR